MHIWWAPWIKHSEPFGHTRHLPKLSSYQPESAAIVTSPVGVIVMDGFDKCIVI